MPAFDALSDPLNGPLHQPLLAPLLDPTIHDDGPLGFDARRPEPTEHAEPTDEPEPADDEWSQEWLSGTWAMAPSALEERRDKHAEPAHDTVAGEEDEAREPRDRPSPRPTPRHRFADDQDDADDPADDAAPVSPEPPHDTAGDPSGHPADDDTAEVEDERKDRGEVDEPVTTDTGAEQDELGLRPESIARLSDADRQLLARLQAELLERRKPGVDRRTGIGYGTGGIRPATNGSRRSAPPDLAG
jgi:hypothetical protein